MVEVENVKYKVQGKDLLSSSSLSFGPNQFHVIMGSNGAGKSTLLKLISGLLRPTEGAIYLWKKEIQRYSKNELAKKRSVLSQHYNVTFPITVKDLVLMGRYPYYQNMPSAFDTKVCKEVIELMEIEEFTNRDYHTLSGGEAQKVQMCRVLAQIWDAEIGSEKILLLDEPVSNLDVKFQYQLMKIAKDLCSQHLTIIAILHDINLALSFADRIIFMKKGNINYDLSDPKEISPSIIHDIFEVKTEIQTIHQKKIVLFFQHGFGNE